MHTIAENGTFGLVLDLSELPEALILEEVLDNNERVANSYELVTHGNCERPDADGMITVTGEETEKIRLGLDIDAMRTNQAAAMVSSMIGDLTVRDVVAYIRQPSTEQQLPHVLRQLAIDLRNDAAALRNLGKVVEQDLEKARLFSQTNHDQNKM